MGVNAQIIAPQLEDRSLTRNGGEDALGHGTRQRQGADGFNRYNLAVAIEQITAEFSHLDPAADAVA